MLKKKTMAVSQSRGTKTTRSKASSTTSQKKTSTKSSSPTPKRSSPQQKLEENLKTLTSTSPRKKTGKTSGKKKTDIISVRSFDKKLFPHGDTFPYRLQDKRDDKLCWFTCLEHAEKYVTRYNMLPKEYRLSYNFHVVGTKET